MWLKTSLLWCGEVVLVDVVVVLVIVFEDSWDGMVKLSSDLDFGIDV